MYASIAIGLFLNLLLPLVLTQSIDSMIAMSFYGVCLFGILYYAAFFVLSRVFAFDSIRKLFTSDNVSNPGKLGADVFFRLFARGMFVRVLSLLITYMLAQHFFVSYRLLLYLIFIMNIFLVIVFEIYVVLAKN